MIFQASVYDISEKWIWSHPHQPGMPCSSQTGHPRGANRCCFSHWCSLAPNLALLCVTPTGEGKTSVNVFSRKALLPLQTFCFLVDSGKERANVFSFIFFSSRNPLRNGISHHSTAHHFGTSVRRRERRRAGAAASSAVRKMKSGKLDIPRIYTHLGDGIWETEDTTH